MEWVKKSIGLLLCCALLAGYIPAPVLAEELSQTGLCEHHPEHVDCSYVQAVEAAVCNHQHDETCITETEICKHVHDDVCGYAEAKDAVACDYVCGECNTQEEKITCDGTVDCAAEEHVEGCEKIAAEQQSAEDCAAADAAAVLIDALPELESIQAKSVTAQQEDYNQVQAAYAVYENLTDNQRALLPSAEEVFGPYFDYFNTLVMETDTSVAVDNTCGENLTWEFDETNGELTISGTGAMYNFGEGTAPWYHYSSQITQVTMDEEITNIGDYAFSDCTSLTEIVLPEKISVIGDAAFSGCSNMKKITFEGPAPTFVANGEGVYTNFSGLGENNICSIYYGINDASWTRSVRQTYGGEIRWVGFLKFPTECGSNLTWHLDNSGTLTISGNGAMDDFSMSRLTVLSPWFENREDIKTVIIGEGVTHIGKNAFRMCSNLVHVFLPNTLKSIGGYSFAGCSRLTELKLPNSVTEIGESAFRDTGNLMEIELPDGLSCIPAYAFSASEVPEITIPASVQTIEQQAFAGSQYQKKIRFLGDAPAFSDDVFASAIYVECYYPVGNETWTDAVLQEYGGTVQWFPDSEYEETSIACGDALSWTYHPDNSRLTISGTGAMYDFEAGTSPWYRYGGVIEIIEMDEGVTGVGTYAFSGMEALENVYFPETMESIGAHAFEGCCELLNVWFVDGITEIGPYAFAGCTRINDVFVPAKVTAIKEGVFSGCTRLSFVTLPNDLVEIGDYAFEGCEEIDLSIPTKVTRLGVRAFANNTDLYDITLPASVTALGAQVFQNCTNLKTIKFQGDAPAFEELNGTQTQDQFSGITATAYYPKGNDTWTEAVMQQYGGQISWTAYDTVVTGACGTGVTWAFDEVSRVLTISGNGVMDNYDDNDDDGVLSMPWAEYLSEVEKIVVEEGVIAIGDYAFLGSNSTNVELPESLVRIGNYALAMCTELPQITIPTGVTSIGDSAFFACVISEMILPDGLTHLGEGAFQSCANLKTIDIPAGLTKISDWTFNHSGLTTITIPGTVDSIGVNAFNHCHLERVTISEGVTSIGDGAFYWTDLTEVTLPETITSIGNDAFCDTHLTNITIPASVRSIGPGAFACSTLLFIEVEDANSSYVNDEAGVLYNKNKTTVVACPGGYQGAYSIPDTVTRIADRAFIGCTNLTNITIPEGVTYIGERAFCTCRGLTEVQIPEGVITLGEAAFNGCTDLAKITIPRSVTSLPNSVLGNTALTSYQIPDSITSIGEYAFSMCDELVEITIPGSVTYMGDCTFYYCTGLEKVVFEGSAPEFGKGSNSGRGVFSGVTATVYYPAGDPSWTADIMHDYDGDITWVPYAANRITVNSVDLADQTSVWIDGAEYAVQTDGDSCYVDLPDGNARTMVTYSYDTGSVVSKQTQYPVSMKVWTLKREKGIYTATRVEELDDILQYSGMSIRVTGKKGIRMITSIEKDKKNSLVSENLAGYTLKEYGTVVAWASQLENGNPLTLGQSYAMSNYAYRKGVADPVFAYNDSLMQYTNVLVNFSDEQCKNELTLRPYMILEDGQGETITLYGGLVTRSIGYIAYQNRNTFAPETEAYTYIWDIIHYVYGDVYDEEFVNV